jgi:hypothetical protein
MSSTLDPEIAEALAPFAAEMAGTTPTPVGDVAARRDRPRHPLAMEFSSVDTQRAERPPIPSSETVHPFSSTGCPTCVEGGADADRPPVRHHAPGDAPVEALGTWSKCRVGRAPQHETVSENDPLDTADVYDYAEPATMPRSARKASSSRAFMIGRSA